MADFILFLGRVSAEGLAADYKERIIAEALISVSFKADFAEAFALNRDFLPSGKMQQTAQA